ncbi:hypothetical protein HHL22_07995 [Hymenobacter sp. RP-2-7]|uniref:Uncharacterized protein n=1 Tax=Hymenobacter polaris TaxID=2682546 RepID=A0A7Y0FM79_9BACT|nr:hypothetical protein [Hymenobacter polaris]NML65144.1 hypothetical protein [Hymenobacter polaris]
MSEEEKESALRYFRTLLATEQDAASWQNIVSTALEAENRVDSPFQFMVVSSEMSDLANAHLEMAAKVRRAIAYIEATPAAVLTHEAIQTVMDH